MRFSYLFSLLGLLSVPVFPLSGRIVDANGAGAAGISVSLSTSSIITTTASDGTWEIPTAPTEISEHFRRTRQAVNGHLVLVDGHLQVSLSGFDPMGRSLPRVVPEPIPSQSLASAPRAVEAVPDTILYSLRGKTFLRDTTSDLSKTGIVANFETLSNPSILYGWLCDSRDGHVYRTIKFGGRTWMAQNLNYKLDNSWCNYNDTGNCSKYGRLYEWAVAMSLDLGYRNVLWRGADSAQHQGVCPSGWHVPIDSEWGHLFKDVGNDSLRSKLCSRSDWSMLGSSFNGTDAYGFAVLPAGQFDDENFYETPGSFGRFLSASENDESSAKWESFLCTSMMRTSTSKLYGGSIRCVKDLTTQVSP